MNKHNKLKNEKSPYLLQHAENPVNWFPWGNEAFKEAKEKDKPVFLSIGYSTCHWCHVMEKESFEDEEVAELMNKYFVSIKVDREERPDIDGIYMTVCQMLTGSGGWPLTIIMTPDKKPFFAGTYFPKKEKFGRIGMLELLPRINEIWKEKRNEVLKSSNEISSALKSSSLNIESKNISGEIFHKAFNELEKRYDPQFGGFGTSPKFPTPHNLKFLLRYFKRNNSSKALEMVEKTLTEMRIGGIYDHVGFGFHRYSTDQKWLVPHFEKMLYDQALIAEAYIECFQITKNDFYKNTAEEILKYVLRDMTSVNGGFFSAEDADSQGEEGKFYLWKKNELKKILDNEEQIIISKFFNIKDDGNWLDQTTGKKNGTNIFYITNNIESAAAELKISTENLEKKIKISLKKLFDHREKRIHPYKDDKILTDWNGLMISAFSKAAQVFNEDKYKTAAENSVKFILNNLRKSDGRLLHRFRDGEAAIDANLDDYVFFISGLLDLYELTFNSFYLETAIVLNENLIKHFWDKENRGFFFTSNDSEQLLFRQKEIYDGAVPSGNSTAILNLLRIARITGNFEYENIASEIVKAFAKQVENSPSAFTQFLVGLDFAFGPSKEILIVGEKHSPETKKILEFIYGSFIPNKVLILNDNKLSSKISDQFENYKKIKNKTTVYVCENYICNLPVTDIEKLKNMLE